MSHHSEPVCRRCAERVKDWHGDDPKCAFITGVFDSGNWNCATMNALRDVVGDPWDSDDWLWSEDQYLGRLAWDGVFIVLSVYKRRGRVEGAWIVSESSALPLAIDEAEAYLAGEDYDREKFQGAPL